MKTIKKRWRKWWAIPLAIVLALSIVVPWQLSRESIIQSEDRWIIQFDIINHEGEEQNYTINIWVDGKPSTESFAVEDGKMFTYIRHIYKAQITKGEVSFIVYREGEDSPIKQVDYYLK